VTGTVTIRVALPAHLRTLARTGAEVAVDVPIPATIASTLDALETRYPVLCGTIRDHDTLKRRAFMRYFACEEDLSHEPPDTPLPEAVTAGREPLIVLGAIAGG
jgi:molybdopterin synthase sulfur carrier subunit